MSTADRKRKNAARLKIIRRAQKIRSMRTECWAQLQKRKKIQPRKLLMLMATRLDYSTIMKRCLRLYYQHLFPWQEFNRWLCYGDDMRFSRREFAFNLTECWFVRNTSFTDYRYFLLYLQRYLPIKIDVGAYYAISLRNRSAVNFQPVEKELVFDIDLSDYDDVRTCCREKRICPKCWKFAATACKILDAFLKEDFGWKLVLWVFSGRRGIHCWVCDESARNMSDEQRKQIVRLLDLRKGRKHWSKTMQLREKRLTHHIRRSYEIAKASFLEVCVEEQNILGADKSVRKFLELLPKRCREKVNQKIREVSEGKERWREFLSYWYNEMISKSDLWKKRRHLIEEIILWYMYPRIDADVTRKMNHLLKIPFSFHKTSEGLCTPFDVKDVDEFDVKNIPRLTFFVEGAVQLQQGDNPSVVILQSDKLQIDNYEKSIKVFKEFVDRVSEATTQSVENV